MAGTSSSARLLCLLLAAPALGLHEDASALVQSAVHAHAGRRAAGGVGAMLDAAFGALGHRLRQAGVKPSADATRQRIALDRFEGGIDSRAAVIMDAVNPDCQDCEFTWGDNVSFQAVVRAPGDFRPGDELAVHLEAAFDVANMDSPLSAMFVGQTFAVHHSCELCTGSCQLSIDKETGDYLDVTVPTTYVGKKYCTEGVHEIVVSNHTHLLPSIDAASLQLSGKVNLSVSLMRDGDRLAASMLSMDFQPTAGTKREQAAPGLLQVGEDLSARSVEAREDAGAGEAEAFPIPESVNAITLELLVNAIESSDGSNISIVANGCESLSNSGSTRCKLKFGRQDSMDTNLHLSSVLQPGSYMLMSLAPKVSGPLGVLVNKQLAKFSQSELEFPLCTDSEDEEVFSFQLFGTWQGFYIPRCGLYEMNLAMTGQEIDLPRVVAIPGLEELGAAFGEIGRIAGKDVNHLPPVSLEVHLKVMRQGAVPIFDAQLKLALEKI